MISIDNVVVNSLSKLFNGASYIKARARLYFKRMSLCVARVAIRKECSANERGEIGRSARVVAPKTKHLTRETAQFWAARCKTSAEENKANERPNSRKLSLKID